MLYQIINIQIIIIHFSAPVIRCEIKTGYEPIKNIYSLHTRKHYNCLFFEPAESISEYTNVYCVG